MERYTIHSEIGRGAFGTVFLAETITNELFAIKVIPKTEANDRVIREIKILKKISHPNIVRYVDYYTDDKNNVCIVMEYCAQGDLKASIDHRKEMQQLFRERDVLLMLYHLGLAVAYIHSQRILHRDIKPQNIFCCSDGSLKLGDFGLSGFMMESRSYTHGRGTLSYMAPELLEDEQRYTLASDIWSLGCVLYEICSLKRLFPHRSLGQTIIAIMRAEVDWERHVLQQFSATTIQMVLSMLNKVPEERPKAVELCETLAKKLEKEGEILDALPSRIYDNRYSIHREFQEPIGYELHHIRGIPVRKRETIGGMSLLTIKSTMMYANEELHIRRVEATSAVGVVPPEKVIMIVGATGSGKTTLINSMANYILGVKWEDTYRVRLVTQDDDEAGLVGQHVSQTKWVTAYTFEHQPTFKVPYKLIVIDTPGFKDTGGIKKDRENCRKIKEFFSMEGPNRIAHIDAIGFTIEATVKRLTPDQLYLFDAVMSIFGKDIADNIFILATHADAGKSYVGNALREAKVPFRALFKFNNSAFFPYAKSASENDADETDDTDEINEDVNKSFFKVGCTSFRTFFSHLGNIQSCSLVLTKETLQQRDDLYHIISDMTLHIENGMNKLQEIKREEEILKVVQRDELLYKDFTYTVTEHEVVKEPVSGSTSVTVCIECRTTCHYDCHIAKDEEKYKCSSMDKNNYCRKCPGHCKWDFHRNPGFRYVQKSYQVKRTNKDLQKKHQVTVERKEEIESRLQELREEYQIVYKLMQDKVKVAGRCLAKLNNIALKPSLRSTIDYLNMLIDNEFEHKKEGWENRVVQLKNLRSEEDTLLATENGEMPFKLPTLTVE